MDVFDKTFVIFGEPASKANSRRIVRIAGMTRSIKSSKALAFVDDFQRQIRTQCSEMTLKDVRVEMVIHYASRRPDLDESLVLDAMQGIVYKNDRQVKQREVYWALDPTAPRVTLRVVECDINSIPAHLMTRSASPPP